jgi:hypothetical protein
MVAARAAGLVMAVGVHTVGAHESGGNAMKDAVTSWAGELRSAE